MPRQRRTLLVVAVAAAVVCAAALLWMEAGPFQQKSVVQTLEQAGDSKVRLRSFQRSYFPSPGCVMEGVEFYHGADAGTPLITIQKLTIRGSYLGVISRRVSSITAEGLHILIPPFGSGQTFHTTPSKITIGEIVANDALLEFAVHKPDTPPLRFEIHELTLHNVGWSGALSYRVRVKNPEPPGEISAEGKFGVWNLKEPGQTPVSGAYKFDHADLSVYGGIAGTLSSAGKFSGVLKHIDIAGTTDTPDFEVQSGGHPVQLIADFNAYVDAIHGDTFLNHVDAHFGRTHVVADGSIAKSPEGHGKVAIINLYAQGGRIEDILMLFVGGNKAPMSGKVNMDAKVEIPPGDSPFLQKVKLRGEFGVGAGKFSSNTQESVDKLSAGARGEKVTDDPETVMSDLTGEVEAKDGTANFANLSFTVPGAHSRMHGTFNLMNYKIDMRGRIRVDTKISNTTSGGKAVLLKMMDPFFHKKLQGEVLPVRISGTYEHPSFGLDLNDKDAQKKQLPKFLVHRGKAK
ncbi:MAG: AsmA-like C-terminal region-containing protein [Candidatus Sulfotelmatobacter sp.]